MKKTRRLALFAATATLAVGALSGCGQSATPTTTGSNGGSTNSAVVNQPMVVVPSPYGTFQPNFSPFQGNANQGTDGLIYQPLFYFDNVSSNVYPFLGTNYSWSNGDKTLTVNLQQHAKWSDGKAFTSKDVVFTFNLFKKYPATDTNGVWNELTSVTANGKYQVIFQFKKADVPFAAFVLGSYIVPQHIWASLGNPSKVNVPNPVGTGPYVLGSFSPEVYTLKANPNYYGGEPDIRNLQYPAYTSNDSADLALAKGQIDWAGIFIPNIQNVYSSKSPNNKYWFPPDGDVVLYPNLTNPLLGNLAVRQAISLGINRQQIDQEGEYGFEAPASPTGLVLPNDNSWIDPSLTSSQLSYSYNPAKAIQILEKAGFKKNAQGIFESSSGQPLSFTLQVVTGWTDWDSDSELISQQLKQIGINVTVQEEQFGSYYSNLTGHNYQLTISWTNNTGPNPYYQYENMLATKGGWNIEQWSNPVTTEALSNFEKTNNLAAQQQQIYKIEKVMVNSLPTIPLVYAATWNEYNDSNITGWPTAQNPYVNPAPFTGAADAVVLMHLHGR